MASDGTFKSMKEEISPALVDVTRTAGKIAAEELPFQRSINPAITPQLAKQNKRLLHIVRTLTKNATAGTDIQPPQPTDADTIEERWHGLVDVFDTLLEKADACLDEFTGVIKKANTSQEAASASSATTSRKTFTSKKHDTLTVPKPQLLFENPPSNNATTPFKPLLRTKPHATKSLNDSISPEAVENGSLQYDIQFYLSPQNFQAPIRELINTQVRYGHPYGDEINSLRFPGFVYESAPPTPYLPLESTTATFVDTLEGVHQMVQELKSAKEIAVDLEHHDTHTYIGLTSLMQISTRSKDWIVDTLKPWRQELQILNDVFADPSILKVLHGAFMDIIWLQRDLGLYVVGLFDTFHASKALGYPKNSLAVLLSRHADFDAAKKYQMADWRIRPLPEEMFNYARSDTHFLLYIYDKLREELLEKSDVSIPDGNLIDLVLSKSKEEALQRYERPFYDAQRGMGSAGWFGLLSYSPALFSREQFAVFRAVHQWRDTVARKEDESVNVVMPKRVIFSMAREMPADMAALLGCSHPITPSVRARAAELLELITKAKEDGATGPDVKEVMGSIISDHSEAARVVAPSTQTAMVVPDRIIPPALISDEQIPSRSVNSLFWGPTVSSQASRSFATQGKAPPDSLRLALPLPQLTAEIYATASAPNGVAESEQVDPGARAEHAYVRDRKPKEDDVFIVKNLGGSKKRKASSLDDHPQPRSPNGMEATLVDDDHHGHEQKAEVNLENALQESAEAERKAAKKAQKKAKKEREKAEKDAVRHLKDSYRPNRHANSDVQMDEPFDYENAPSVLHAKPESSGPKGSSNKGFDPYSKSLDAPKGLGRARKEMPGKSFTFKS